MAFASIKVQVNDVHFPGNDHTGHVRVTVHDDNASAKSVTKQATIAVGLILDQLSGGDGGGGGDDEPKPDPAPDPEHGVALDIPDTAAELLDA